MNGVHQPPPTINNEDNGNIVLQKSNSSVVSTILHMIVTQSDFKQTKKLHGAFADSF
jgi:hypothetical protein